MSDMVPKAMDRLLARLHDPLRQATNENTAGMIVEFRDIEREWKKALEPRSLQDALKRLGVEIERQEGLLSDMAAEANTAGRSWEHAVGKSARLMTIRLIIGRDYP